MAILILGSEGQLGLALRRRLGEKAKALSRADLDISDSQAVIERIEAEKPSAVINTAAYTAVDRAEQDRDACFAINARAVEAIAEGCRRADSLLVQVSTDYVYAAGPMRDAPYKETDPPCPAGVYATSKLEGERATAKSPKHVIVRTCGLYGERSKPTQSNFVDTMIRLGRERDRLRVVDDQHCTPSYVEHVAQAIIFLVQTQAHGLFHVTNAGQTTWHELAVEIFEQCNMPVTVDRITTAEYGAAAPRPAYSVLDTSRYNALGGPPLPHWRDALREYLTVAGYIDS